MSTRRNDQRLLLLAAVVAIGFGAEARADEAETLQRAADAAIADLAAALRGLAFDGVTNAAVVPLQNDTSGYITERVRDAVAQTKLALFTREDSAWKELLAEIEWSNRREDVMNPETVQKFGKIEGVDAILYGRVWDNAVSLWNVRGHVKVSLALAEVETGRELWRSTSPFEGEAYLHWSDAVTRFWRYPLVLTGFVVLFGIAGFVLMRFRRAYKRL